MKPWTRSDTLVLASERCTVCGGSGMRRTRRATATPCNCVLREIFRICHNRFRVCAEKSNAIPCPTLERGSGGSSASRSYLWSRKDEEYVADFCLVSRRVLRGQDWDIFRFRFLLGADWRLCCTKLGMDRGSFFHEVYKIEQKLGRTFRDLQPYALYPLDEYFGNTVKREPDEEVKSDFDEVLEYANPFDEEEEEPLADWMPTKRKIVPIRPPLAKVRSKKEDEEDAA